jgi:hypothetical protein
MRPGHEKMRHRAARAAWPWLLLVAAFITAQAHAQTPAPIVLLCEPHEAELLARIRGQAQDLAVELQTVDARALSREPASLAATLHARGARALLCLDAEQGGGHSVFVFDAASGEAHVREVPPAHEDDALAASAARETLAIIVRSELGQLLSADVANAPGAASTPQPSAADAATPVPVSPPADTAPAAGAAVATSATPRASPPAWLRLGLGWELAALGPAHFAHASAARAGIALGVFELAASGAFGLASTPGDASAQAAARVQRHVGRLSLLSGWPRDGALRFLAGAHVGLFAFARTTRLVGPPLVATHETTTFCGVFGPDVVLRLQLTPALGLDLALLADLVPAAPRYALEQAGVTHVIAHENAVEPALNLDIFWSL